MGCPSYVECLSNCIFSKILHYSLYNKKYTTSVFNVLYSNDESPTLFILIIYMLLLTYESYLVFQIIVIVANVFHSKNCLDCVLYEKEISKKNWGRLRTSFYFCYYF